MSKAYLCMVLMQHEMTHEWRLLSDLAIAESEEKALLHAQLLAHPGHGGVDHWTTLHRQVEELDRETLEEVAREVLGWSEGHGS